MVPKKPLPAREAARRKMPLDGADAQALEGALSLTERERDAARAEILKAQKALGNGVDDGVWRPGESAVDALIRALADADEDVARYRRQLEEIVELVGEGGDGSAFGSVESMLATFTLRQEVYQKQRDEARKYAEERNDEANKLQRFLNMAAQERDEARLELAHIRAEYEQANASDLTRDALALQNAALRAEVDGLRGLRQEWERLERNARHLWRETSDKLDSARFELNKAQEELERLRWLNEAGCENTPTKGCECPGCCTARERAERGEA